MRPRTAAIVAMSLPLALGVTLATGGCGGSGSNAPTTAPTTRATSQVVVHIAWPTIPSRHIPANTATLLLDVVQSDGTTSVGISATAVPGQSTVTLANVPVGAGLKLKATAWSGQPNSSTQMAETSLDLDTSGSNGAFNSAPQLTLASDVSSLGMQPVAAGVSEGNSAVGNETYARALGSSDTVFNIPVNRSQTFSLVAKNGTASVLLNTAQDVVLPSPSVVKSTAGTGDKLILAFNGGSSYSKTGYTLGLVGQASAPSTPYAVNFVDDVAIGSFASTDGQPTPISDSRGLYVLAQNQGLKITPTITTTTAIVGTTKNTKYTVRVYQLASGVKDAHAPFAANGQGTPTDTASYRLVDVYDVIDNLAPAAGPSSDGGSPDELSARFTDGNPFILRIKPKIRVGGKAATAGDAGNATTPHSYQVVITSGDDTVMGKVSGQAVIPITINRESTATINIPATVYKDSLPFTITTGSTDSVSTTVLEPGQTTAGASSYLAPVSGSNNTSFTFTPTVNMPTGSYTLTFQSASLGGQVSRTLNVPSVGLSISTADGMTLPATTATAPYTMTAAKQRFVATVTGARDTSAVWSATLVSGPASANAFTIDSNTGDFSPNFTAASGSAAPVYRLTAVSHATVGATTQVSQSIYVTVATGAVNPIIN